MGLIKSLQPFFYRSMTYIELKNCRMCELGNQSYELPNGKSISAKEYFTEQGVDHTSMDWNGKDGAIPVDFNKPLSQKFIDKFEVITNIGMTEHVKNQYQCFKNIHQLCKVGGRFIHMVPIFYYWVDKNNLHFYYPKFFHLLADALDYSIILEEITPWGKNKNQDLLSVCMKKISNVPFLSEKEFSKFPMRAVGAKITLNDIGV